MATYLDGEREALRIAAEFLNRLHTDENAYLLFQTDPTEAVCAVFPELRAVGKEAIDSAFARYKETINELTSHETESTTSPGTGLSGTRASLAALFAALLVIKAGGRKITIRSGIENIPRADQ